MLADDDAEFDKETDDDDEAETTHGGK
jgi:hypothetical protein